jgi:hypothetical protein
MSKDLTNRARFAWKSATEQWPASEKKKVKDPGPLFDKWAKIQIAIEKNLAQLAALDAQLGETVAAIKKTLDDGNKLVAAHKERLKLWVLMRKLLSELHRHFCDANADKMAAMHVTKQPMKLD